MKYFYHTNIIILIPITIQAILAIHNHLGQGLNSPSSTLTIYFHILFILLTIYTQIFSSICPFIIFGCATTTMTTISKHCIKCILICYFFIIHTLLYNPLTFKSQYLINIFLTINERYKWLEFEIIKGIDQRY